LAKTFHNNALYPLFSCFSDTMPHMNTTMKREHRIALTVAGILLLIIAGFYFAGYRFHDGSIAGPGSVTVNTPAGATVFIDGDEQTGGPEFRLSAGTHAILVAANGRWPWKKDVSIGGADQAVTPFLISTDPKGNILAATSSDYRAAVQALAAPALPTESNPLISSDNNLAVWVNGNAVMAKWQGEGSPDGIFSCTGDPCATARNIFNATEDIRSLSFYPGWNNVLFIAVSNGIFALETDQTGGQNFQPVYKGTSPVFKLKDMESMYVRDQNRIMLIELK
jgi:hypothetical protein